MNTPVQHLCFGSYGIDFTGELNFNTNILSLEDCRECPMYVHIIERNLGFQKLKKSFHRSIFKVKWFDVKFIFESHL
jgi:hypothetical protein